MQPVALATVLAASAFASAPQTKGMTGVTFQFAASADRESFQFEGRKGTKRCQMLVIFEKVGATEIRCAVVTGSGKERMVGTAEGADAHTKLALRAALLLK